MASQQPKEANQIRDAPDPFADLDADVIIRAGGAVDFRVHKFILIRAFDTFASIFEDGSSTGGGQEYKNGLPIIPMQEAPDVVEGVLRLYYPEHTAPVYPLATLYSICRTLDKYCAKAYPPLLRRDLLAAATQYPSEIYAIACHYRLPEVGQAAARAMLPIDKPLMKLPDTFAVMVNGVQYNAFLRYMATCQQRSLDAVSNLDWLKSNSSLDADISKKREGCTCKRTKLPGPTLSKVTVPLWLGDYLAGVHGCLSANPSGTTALMPKHFLAAGVLNTRDCGTCRVVHIATQLPTLAALLQNEIDRRISGVMLPDSTFK